MIRTLLTAASLLLAAPAFTVPAFVVPAFAVEIVPVEGPETGVPGLLVEDRTNPIVTLRLSFEGGELAEREGEDGLVRLLSSMLDEGAGDLDSIAFQDRLDQLGVRFFASADQEVFRLGVSALADRFDEAVELLALALNEPRFDQEPLARMKRQISSSMRARMNTPRAEASRRVAKLVWGDHPYARDTTAAPDTIEAATADDLRAVHERIFARDNATVAAVGAIDADQLEAAIDRVLGALPEEAQTVEIAQTKPAMGVEETLTLPGAQASLRVVLPAPKREDEDFFAAYLVNHVLGGGSFTSRLYEELREKRGLTYGAGSGISTRDAAASWTASVSTRPENLDEARSIMLGEVERMAREGPTEEELAAAKSYVKGSYAINNLDDSGSIARVLLGIQEGDLGIDYIDAREDQIDAVTIEDARRVAAKYLSADPTVITIVPEGQG